jgi:hypothetical protein
MHRPGRRLDFGIFFPDCHVLKCINLPPKSSREPHKRTQRQNSFSFQIVESYSMIAAFGVDEATLETAARLI